MRKDKEEVFKKRKSGLSYRTLSKEMRIPKSTLSKWLSGHEWSGKIREELEERKILDDRIRIISLDKIRGKHLRRIYEEAELEAREDLKSLKTRYDKDRLGLDSYVKACALMAQAFEEQAAKLQADPNGRPIKTVAFY
jgi:transposase-like protein